jgi:hypothetical protein
MQDEEPGNERAALTGFPFLIFHVALLWGSTWR